MSWHIYILLDPRTGKVRYVGCSSNIDKRLDNHLSESKHGEPSPKSLWIKELLEESLLPIMEIVESADGKAKALAAEKRWMDKFKNAGHDLTNIHYPKIEEENIALIREALRLGAAPATIARFFKVTRQFICQIRDHKVWK